MKITTDENGFVRCFAYIGTLVDGIDVPEPEDIDLFLHQFYAFRLQDGQLVYDSDAYEAYVTEETKEEYRRRRDLVVCRLREIPGVKVEEPMGAFYVMASLPVDDSDKFQRWLLQDFDDNGDTVMFAPGAPFYETPGKGINEVRIAYVLNEADLDRAMDLLAKGIARYRTEQM